MDGSEFLGFLAAVAALVLIPGQNTMLILANSMAGGRSAGLATVAGIEVGTLVHTLAAALGLSVLLSASDLSFHVVKYLGITYLVAVGLRALLDAKHRAALRSGESDLDLPRVFRRALLANVLNPKVALFFLSLLPQFVRPERGHVMLQFATLGLIVSGFGICFGSLLALAAARVTLWLSHGAVAEWQARLTGCVFLALAGWLALARRGR